MDNVSAMPVQVDSFLPHLRADENVRQQGRVEAAKHGVPVHLARPCHQDYRLGPWVHGVAQVCFTFFFTHFRKFAEEFLDSSRDRFKLGAARLHLVQSA